MKNINDITNPRTTDLDKLKNGARFTWGELVKIHEITDYAIVEYVSDFNGSDKGQTRYAGYVNGVDCAESYLDMDSALAGCIAYKHEGCNHRADGYFIKMITEA